jgi:RNA polymerase sigma-70 factor (ECF subfamily)
MKGLADVLPFPVSATEPRVKSRVDHRNTEEAALVRRVQARDELAFREIVERYQAKVFSIIFGILRNHNDAEDIAQQVFSKIYFSIKNFDFRSSLLTWIYKITVDTQLAQRDLVVKLIAKLSPQDRSLLLLKEVEGHSVEELAQMTGMNENTIKVKLFRARQKLVKASQRLKRVPGQMIV